jgi:hypothetical protein
LNFRRIELGFLKPTQDGYAVSQSHIRTAITAIMATIALAIARPGMAQTSPVPETQLGEIMGTVADVNDDAVIGATVVLAGPDAIDHRTVVTPENGFFQFNDLKPAVPYQLMISANGFAEWESSPITLETGEAKLLGGITLRLATQITTVTVTDNPVEIATEQVKIEETQRILGVLPNFYVSYEGDNTLPLTTKMKFQLAFKVSYDPVTIGAVSLFAGLRQATNSPNYPQGLKGYGERFGATAAEGFSDIIIGGAILPSLLHQDPRYFYQGRGSTGSRLRHAILSPFIAKGDNGNWQPNYSSIGGDLGSSALSNLYFPKSNRGSGLIFSQFAIGTAERVIASVAQEFMFGKLTHRGHQAEQASEP